MAGKKTEKLWSFFTKIETLDKKNAKVTCQIKVPAGTGQICGKLLGIPDSSTSSLRTHLRSFHPDQTHEVVSFEAAWDQKRDADTKKLERLYNQVEKRTPNMKRDQPDHDTSTSSNSETEFVGTPGTINFPHQLFLLISILNYIFGFCISNFNEYYIF